jgi:hypothetical protein
MWILENKDTSGGAAFLALKGLIKSRKRHFAPNVFHLLS